MHEHMYMYMYMYLHNIVCVINNYTSFVIYVRIYIRSSTGEIDIKSTFLKQFCAIFTCLNEICTHTGNVQVCKRDKHKGNLTGTSYVCNECCGLQILNYFLHTFSYHTHNAFMWLKNCTLCTYIHVIIYIAYYNILKACDSVVKQTHTCMCVVSKMCAGKSNYISISSPLHSLHTQVRFPLCFSLFPVHNIYYMQFTLPERRRGRCLCSGGVRYVW